MAVLQDVQSSSSQIVTTNTQKFFFYKRDTIPTNNVKLFYNLMRKNAQRDANTARTGCSKVPTLPARCKHRQDRLQYTAPQLASAQCNNNSKRNVYFNSLLRFAFRPVPRSRQWAQWLELHTN